MKEVIEKLQQAITLLSEVNETLKSEELSDVLQQLYDVESEVNEPLEEIG